MRLLQNFVLAHAHHRARLALGAAAGALVIGFASYGALLGFQRWRFGSQVRVARQWMKAGNLERAQESADKALASAPGRPEALHLASELALRRGRGPEALRRAEEAAAAGGFSPDYVLDWAETAVCLTDAPTARRALARLGAEVAASSARAQRAEGELARQHGDFRTARDRFDAARGRDEALRSPDLAADEVQLGLACLASGIASDRDRGLGLLSARATDGGEWGATALRALLADSVERGDRASMAKWALSLRRHPRCTLADLRSCLVATSHADEEHFHAMLGGIRALLAPSQLRTALLLDWLGELGNAAGAERLALARSVSASLVRSPPLFVAVAETFRTQALWDELKRWTQAADWGGQMAVVRATYAFHADRRLGAAREAELDRSEIRRLAASDGAQAHFAARLLYAWDERATAVELLWTAADSPEANVEALGMLARHYQAERDAAGQCRAFARLHLLRPADRSIANNYAFFAAVTKAGNGTEAERIARYNLAEEPSNEVFRSCYAFILASDGRSGEALKVLGAVSARWKSSPAVAFAYAVALAGAGRAPEAREVGASLDPRGLTGEEVRFLGSVLN